MIGTILYHQRVYYDYQYRGNETHQPLEAVIQLSRTNGRDQTRSVLEEAQRVLTIALL